MIDDAVKKLLDYARTEASSEELQKLPVNSYAQLIQEIINKVPTAASADNEITGRIEGLVRSGVALLLESRFRKIARMIKEGKSIPEERLLIEERRLVLPLMELRITASHKEPRDLVITSFKKSFPHLYSVRLVTLGPFTQFDVAVIPKADAEELAKRNVADMVIPKGVQEG